MKVLPVTTFASAQPPWRRQRELLTRRQKPWAAGKVTHFSYIFACLAQTLPAFLANWYRSKAGSLLERLAITAL